MEKNRDILITFASDSSCDGMKQIDMETSLGKDFSYFSTDSNKLLIYKL